jgi:hypothetical protein
MKTITQIIGLTVILSMSPAGIFSQELPEDFPAFHTIKTGETGEGYIFLTVSADKDLMEGVGYYAFMIDNDGKPFKYRQLEDDYSYDFKVQPSGLTSYAQFLSHHDYTGGGNCIHMVLDEEMNVVDSFQLGNGYIAEAHDFQLLPNGHVLAFGYYMTRMDLSDVVEGGYPNALVSGGVVQELDADKNVIWQWRSWDHYSKYDVEFGRRSGLPVVSQFHLNTINLDFDDNILLATPSWTKKIDRQTGKIMWHLGGFENEFSFVGVDSTDGVSDVTGHAFYRLENGNYLIYDNGPRQGPGTSEAHEYRIDEENRIAEKIMTITPDTAIKAWHRGNAQRLPNGNTLVGWGGATNTHIPTCTEFDADGNTVLKVYFDDPVAESYRAVRFPYPPVHQYEAGIFEVSEGVYNLMQGDTLDIGIEIKVTDLISMGYSELNVTTHEYAPRFPRFYERAPMVLPMRVMTDAFNLNQVSGEISFNAGTFGISNPEEITVYYRAEEGEGEFVPLPTAYNPVKGEITATFDGTGEFIFTYPDLEHQVFRPLTVYPENGKQVNYQHSIQMEWSPQGFYNSFALQMAGDIEFADLLLDTTGVKSTIHDLWHTDVNDTVYWRVKTFNDAGESDWSDTAFFTTMAPYIELTSPVGDEVWLRGLDYFVEWDDNLGEDVVLELFYQDEKLATIDTVESSNAYYWEIPYDLDSACSYYIRISSVDDPAIHDISAITFSLNDSSCSNEEVPDVQVMSPNGGEVFQKGNEVLVTWENNTGEMLTVDLYKAGILQETLFTGADGNSVNWTIPYDASTGSDFRIVLTGEGSLQLTDASNSDFAIAQGEPASHGNIESHGSGLNIYPNPAYGTVNIEYTLYGEEPVVITVLNLVGMELETIRIPSCPPGTHRIQHNMDHHPAGTYVIRCVTGREVRSGLLHLLD